VADYDEAKIWINLAERDYSVALHLHIVGDSGAKYRYEH